MHRTIRWLVPLLAIGLVTGACSDDDSGNNNGNGGGDAGLTDGGSGGDGSTVDAGPPSSIDLTGTLRDFQDTHPDFEGALGAETGIVADDLGQDGKPVYAGGSGTITTTGADNFNQWYNDTPGVNQSTPYTITLVRDADGVYTYDNPAFFPIDGQLFGNQGRTHNYHFTYELHTEFTYKGGEVFTFTGDDDLWVFINGRLAIDLGGVHGPMSETADLDAQATDLGIAPGNSYTLDFFFAERHTTESNFRIDTTITDLTPIVR